MNGTTYESRKAISDSPATALVTQASRLKSLAVAKIWPGQNLARSGSNQLLDRDDLVVPEASIQPGEACPDQHQSENRVQRCKKEPCAAGVAEMY